MSRMAFCKQVKINYATFNYWHKRFSAAKNQTGFSEITLAAEKNSVGAAELVFPSGIRMVFPSAPPIPWLKELIG